MTKVLPVTVSSYYQQAQDTASSYYQKAQKIAKKYEAETDLAENLIFNGISILANDIFNLPKAKVVKQNLTIIKSAYLFPLSLTSAHNLVKLKIKSVNDAIRNLSSAILIPFTLIEVSSHLGLKKWGFVHDFFKASPILSHLKFAGIPNIAIIGLLSSFAFDSYAKGQKLQNEKVGMTGDELKKHEIKIIQNNWSLAGKTVKVASSVFSFAMLVASYSHPAITAIKISFLVLDMGIALKKYQTQYLDPEKTVNADKVPSLHSAEAI